MLFRSGDQDIRVLQRFEGFHLKRIRNEGLRLGNLDSIKCLMDHPVDAKLVREEGGAVRRKGCWIALSKG